MSLTKRQIDILRIVYAKDSISSKLVSQQLNNSHAYISKLITDLKENGFLKKTGSKYSISDNICAYALRNLILRHPKTNFNEIISDSRIDILILLLDKRTRKRIEHLSGLSKSLIYKYFWDFLKYGVIIKEGRYYRLNKILWPELVDFLESYSKYKDIFAYNLPGVYRDVYKSKNLMIIEVPPDLNVDEKTASLTAFSKFQSYGIFLRLNYNYYCVPPKKIGINDIFAHAILLSNDIRKRTFSILFYLKNKDLLDLEYIDRKYKLRSHINKINAILKGERLKDYPMLEEIKQKAELYDIKY